MTQTEDTHEAALAIDQVGVLRETQPVIKAGRNPGIGCRLERVFPSTLGARPQKCVAQGLARIAEMQKIRRAKVFEYLVEDVER